MKGNDSATAAMADSSTSNQQLQNGTSTGGTEKTFRSQAELLDSIADVSQEVIYREIFVLIFFFDY